MKSLFLPGTCSRKVPVAMAPKERQEVIKKYGRPEYEAWFAQNPQTQPLDAPLVEAFGRWDQEIGAQKTK